MKQKYAILYLRVSTSGQVNTDFNPEGLSIPAQRVACLQRARDLGAVVVDEYVEPGQTALSTAKRPAFQKMMARIKAEGGVDYVIVYARSRLHRNSVDAALTKRDLREYHTQLISVMDYTEDTYIGDLVATVIDGVNEYQSRASGADVSYKMTQKAKAGGTVSWAPLGYSNVTTVVDSRHVHTVELDPVRAPLIRHAGVLLMSGLFTLPELTGRMVVMGLTLRPDKYHPARPITARRLVAIFRNPYYAGQVCFKNQTYPGRHPSIFTLEEHQTIVSSLDSLIRRHTHHVRHDSWHKGLLVCGRCGGQLYTSWNRGHLGVIYPYVLCPTRATHHACDLPTCRQERVEQAVLASIEGVRFSTSFVAAVVEQFDRLVRDKDSTEAALGTVLENRLGQLRIQEQACLDLIGDPAWPREVLTERYRQLSVSRSELERELASHWSQIRRKSSATFDPVEVLQTPGAIFRGLRSLAARRLFLRTVFVRLAIDMTPGPPAGVASVVGERITDPDPALMAQALWEFHRERDRQRRLVAFARKCSPRVRETEFHGCQALAVEQEVFAVFPDQGALACQMLPGEATKLADLPGHGYWRPNPDSPQRKDWMVFPASLPFDEQRKRLRQALRFSLSSVDAS